MAKLYIGNLDKHADKRDLENEFTKFGKIREVWVARHPPGFAFVTFDDDKDAEDAVRELDDRNICGSRIKVEWAKSSGRKPPPSGGRGGRGGGRDDGGGREGGYRGRSRSPPPRNFDRDRSRSPAGGPPPRRRSPSPFRRRSPSPKRERMSPPPRNISPARRSRSPARVDDRRGEDRRSFDRDGGRGGSPRNGQF